MKKTTITTKFANDGLTATFAGLEEALMADTVQLKAIDEDIKTLALKLKKLSFEAAGLTYCPNGIKAGKVGYDYDKKIIMFKRTDGTEQPLLAQTPAIRKEVYNGCLDELLVHLKFQFENKTKPDAATLTTINVATPSTPKPGIFSRTSA